MENIATEQAGYTQALKSDNVRCTCDEILRETDITKARGHYSHCMLHQIVRAIEIGQKFERESIRASVDLWQLSDNFLKKEDYERLMRLITKKG